MRRVTLLILLMLVVAGALGGRFWCWRRSRIPPRVNASEFESDMTAGLVSGVVGELGSNHVGMCFLAFGEGWTPPTRAFIAKFDGSRPRVRGCSASVGPPIIGKFFETSSGKPGVIIRIIRFREITPSLFETVVTFSNLPPGRDRFVYRVANQGGEWVVLNRKPE